MNYFDKKGENLSIHEIFRHDQYYKDKISLKLSVDSYRHILEKI